MAEFKISEGLSQEIDAMQQAGAEPETAALSASGSLSTLKTCEQFAAEHAEIRALISSYCALVKKDAGDLRAMMQDAQKMDPTLAGSY